MNLAIWLPGLFVLGLVSLGLCFLFLEACERNIARRWGHHDFI